jgi:hypothetical protein
MRQLFMGLLFLGTISCSKTNQQETDNTDLKFNVDSVFVDTFTTKDLVEVAALRDFKVSDDDHRFNTSPLRFYDYKTQKLSDTIDLKIILAYPVFSAVFEGELKLVYLMTFGKSGKLIDALRVGRTESAAEWHFSETSIIGDNFINRKSDESSYEEDSTGGRRVHKLKSDAFKITNEGRIKRQPT